MEIIRTNIGRVIIFLMFGYFATSSCANTSTPPMGGPKDTIPPLLIEVVPDSGAISFPLEKGILTMTFDEYVVLKDPQQNIFLSPPQKKQPEAKIKGKSVIVRFQEKLDSNKTYSLHFGNSIQDNNEGNPFYKYVLPFSTGSYVDSFMVSGIVSHASTLMPANGVVVAIYNNLSDSAIYSANPSAVAKTDNFGYFVVRNIKKEPYSVYAFEDLNNNFRYDRESERVAFMDSLLVPTKVLSDTLKELEYVGEKDTLKAISRPVEKELYLFREDNEKQFIRESKRLQHRMAYLLFSAANPIINSLEISGLDESSFVTEHNIRKDSIVLWVTDTTIVMPDTMKVKVEYMKTDSTGNLTSFKENFNLPKPKPAKIEEDDQQRQSTENEVKKRADLLEFKIVADPALIEQSGFQLVFDAPLSYLNRDSISLIYKTPKGETGIMDYAVSYDSLWRRIVNIRPNGVLLKGYDYTLDISEASFMDIYKRTNDSIVKSVSLPQDESLSKLTLDIQQAHGHYIIELTNVTRDKIFRSYSIDRDTILEFPYLQKGPYSVKITEDLNGNGIGDTGNLSQKRQPEKVRLYTLPDGKSIILIPESTELVQSIKLNQIFNPDNND